MLGKVAVVFQVAASLQLARRYEKVHVLKITQTDQPHLNIKFPSDLEISFLCLIAKLSMQQQYSSKVTCRLINLPVFECVHKQKQNICHSASPVNQNEEGSSILYAENSSVHISWERGNVIAVSVNEVFERTCHLSSLCGLYSPKDTTAEDLCRMHIVPGLHLVEDLVKAKTVWTLSGHQLTFSSQVKDLLR